MDGTHGCGSACSGSSRPRPTAPRSTSAARASAPSSPSSLLARGEIVPAERLAESVWRDRPRPTPPGALQAYVSHLRRRLQPGSAARTRSAVIVSEGRGYAVRLPRGRRRRLAVRAAAPAGRPPRPTPARIAGAPRARRSALWRGPALAEYADEPWAEAEIARLTELRTVARERLLAARLELGEAALLVPDLEAMVAEEPLREERWRLLVLALYRAHRQADALSALRRARTTLADELGVDPGPALRELESQVLRSRRRCSCPRPRRAAAPERRRRPPRPRRTTCSTATASCGAVRTALDDLVDGRAAAAAHRGSRPGSARPGCSPRRGGWPASARCGCSPPAAASWRRRSASAPSGSSSSPSSPTPDRREELLARGGGQRPRRLRPGRRRGGGRLVRRPARAVLAGGQPHRRRARSLLAVDDVQWCDSASLRWLAYLVRRLDGAAGAGRRHGAHRRAARRRGAAGRARAGAGRRRAAARSRCRPRRPPTWSSGGSASRSRRCSPRPATGRPSGNPLLLRQLLRGAGGRRRPARRRARRLGRGGRLAGGVEHGADAAAPAGRARSPPSPGRPPCSATAPRCRRSPRWRSCPKRDTAAALAALARAEIVKDEQPLAFVHPLVREAVYRDLPAAERELRHERAAAVLRAAGASDEQVAAHLLLAPTARRRRPRWRCCGRRPAPPPTAARPTAPSPTCAGPWPSRPPATARRDVLVELGLLESLLDGAAGAEHLLQAYGLHDDPADPRRDRDRDRPHPGVRQPAGRRDGVRPGGAAALPAELTDQRQALLALRADQRLHARPGRRRLADARTRRSPTATGTGAQMLAATLAFEATVDGDRPRARRRAGPVRARRRPALAVDDGLFWVVAAVVRMLADDDLGDFWARARARGARARLAVRGAVDQPLGGLLAVAARASCTRRWPAWRCGARPGPDVGRHRDR